jgi:hypothetical protein
LALERISQSKENRQEAGLAMAKTMRELQSIDMNQIQQLLSIVQALKQAAAEDPTEAPTEAAAQSEQSQMPEAFAMSSLGGGQPTSL